MKNKVVSVLTRLLAVVALVAGGVAVATPAQAVTCYGDACSGRDPQATGCAAGAYTATSWGNGSFLLETRYSPACKTNWARLTMYNNGNCSPSGTLSAIQDTGYTRSKYVGSACSASFTQWSEMIYSPVRLVRSQFATPWGTYSTPWA